MHLNFLPPQASNLGILGNRLPRQRFPSSPCLLVRLFGICKIHNAVLNLHTLRLYHRLRLSLCSHVLLSSLFSLLRQLGSRGCPRRKLFRLLGSFCSAFFGEHIFALRVPYLRPNGTAT